MRHDQAALLAIMALAVGATLLAERSGSRWQWAAKTLASLSFVALGLVSGASAWMLAALVLALAGDVLLVPRDRRVFRAGIAVFLLAHVALMFGFAQGKVEWPRVAFAGLALAAAAVLVLIALVPRVPRALKPAVVAYALVISVMVALAAGRGWLLLPALAFYASDLLVARDRFVERRFWHRAVGLPLYYGAMASFALSGA